MGKFLLILLMLASANSFAEVNKWIDDQGRVHYSDQPPPPDVQAKVLGSGSDGGASGVTATGQPTFVEQEAAVKRAQQADQAAAAQAAAKQAADDALKASCNSAQQNLRNLQSGVRIMNVNSSGDRYFIDDAQRQQRIDKAQQDVSNYCK